jgi:hypothetical protein
VQRDPDRLDASAVAGHPGQVVGQQPTGPQRTVDPNLVGIQVGDPDQLLLPPGGVVGWLTGVGPVRHGVRPAGQVALEHPADGIGAASDQLRDLGWGVTLRVEQDHLVAGAGLGVAGGVVAAFQLGLGVGVQGHLQGRRRHDRPPCEQER